ncbi:MAG: hypothetical protein FWG36_09885 [Oscillospiraceae bacterium]|nr:hypothetical protein [Oscillospiraceae bacterium]
MKIVILAKSNKRRNNGNYGKCVAGLNADGDWIRLVSNESGDSLADKDCRHFECLDVIDVDATEAPLEYQPENMILEHLNRKIGQLPIERIIEKFGTSDDKYCFINSNHLLSEREMKRTDNSLKLFDVKNLHIYKNDNNSYKADFEYKGIHYNNFSMTAPCHFKEYTYDNAYIVVSIPPRDGGYSGYYKFVAAIYPI